MMNVSKVDIDSNSLPSNSLPSCALVVGARGGIGSAVLAKMLKDEMLDSVYAVSRAWPKKKKLSHDKLIYCKADGREPDIKAICSQISSSGQVLKYVVIASGLLHDEHSGIYPEKRIEDIRAEALETVFSTNTFLPILWLKELSRLLDKDAETKVVVLSARVGSISDNLLGGWYSYRASKSALNMLLQTLAIEYKRRFPKVRVLAFHPGTTDTLLSKPFQSRVPEGKLFSKEFVADRLYQLLRRPQPEAALSFIDWDFQEIAW